MYDYDVCICKYIYITFHMHDTIYHKLLRSDHVLMIFYWIHDA